MNKYLNLPPPDRSIFLQSPPPTAECNDDPTNLLMEEEAPFSAGPLEYLPQELEGKIVYQPKPILKCCKVPTLVIENENQ